MAIKYVTAALNDKEYERFSDFSRRSNKTPAGKMLDMIREVIKDSSQPPSSQEPPTNKGTKITDLYPFLFNSPCVMGIPLTDEHLSVDPDKLGIFNASGVQQPSVVTKQGKFLKVEFFAKNESYEIKFADTKVKPTDLTIDQIYSSMIKNNSLSARFVKNSISFISYFSLNGKLPLDTFPTLNFNGKVLFAEDVVLVSKSDFYCVVLQKFKSEKLLFELYSYIYSNSPFIRFKLAVTNTGNFGFTLAAEPQTINNLSINFESTAFGTFSYSAVSIGNDKDLYIKGNGLELAVPEFYQNYPAQVTSVSGKVSVNFLNGGTLEGKKQKTWELYLGTSLENALKMTYYPVVNIDKNYTSKAIGLPVSEVTPEIKTVKNAVDRLAACAYDIKACEGNSRIQPATIDLYRRRYPTDHYGWKNIGDLAWADGFCNNHYDIHYILFREWLRSGNVEAYRLGSEHARFRATLGQIHGEEFQDSGQRVNCGNISVYEKNDHNNYMYQTPRVTHHWVEGLWLHYFLTLDEFSKASAESGTDYVLNLDPIHVGSAYAYNDLRMVGWPINTMMAGYKYTGNKAYLNKAKEFIYWFIEKEKAYGSKGYFIPDGYQNITPWQFGGYCVLGMVKYYRETKDTEVANYLLRVANWVLNDYNPVLYFGDTDASGNYRAIKAPFLWYEDKKLQVNSLPDAGFAQMFLPLLVEAYLISKDVKFKDKAYQLYKDTAFYRDMGNEFVPVSQHTPINFDSIKFVGTQPKIFGQTNLFIETALQLFL